MADVPKFEDTLPLEEKAPKFEDTSPIEEPKSDGMPKPSQGEAIARGLGQGLFGFGDEAAAGIQAAMDVATSEKKITDLKDLYQTYKQLQQEREEETEKAYPKTYLGSEIASSLGTALVPGGQASTAAKAAKLGATYGLGKSKADLTKGEVVQAGKDASVGGLLGLLGLGASKAIGKGAEKIGLSGGLKSAGEKLSTNAEDVALSTLGSNRKALEQEIGQSIFTDPEFRKGIGREILETRGVLDSPGDLKGKFADKIRAIEAEKKPLLESSDRKLKEFIASGGKVEGSLADQLKAIRDKIVDRESKTATDIGSVGKLGEQLDETIGRYSNNDLDIQKLNEFKKLLGTKLKDPQWSKQSADLPQEAEFVRESYDTVNKRLQSLSDVAEPSSGQLLKDMGRKENILYDSAKLAKDAQIKDLSKEASWNPWDVVGSQVDKAKILSAQGLDKTGQALTISGKLIENPTLITTGARPVLEDKREIEQRPLKMSEALYSAPDEDLKSVAGKLETNPQYAAYGKSLNKALEDGSKSKKNAVLFTILQNPNIRKFVSGEE